MRSREFQHSGLTCEVTLTAMGHHCGYVAVPASHPWFGKVYSDRVRVPRDVLERPISDENVGAITMFCASINVDLDRSEVSIDLAIDVHGGLTYSGKDKVRDLWWFGFDCAHCDDGRSEGEDGWKDDAFTEAQCRRLADQLIAVAQWPTP
jgi:hypothetical protein